MLMACMLFAAMRCVCVYAWALNSTAGIAEGVLIFSLSLIVPDGMRLHLCMALPNPSTKNGAFAAHA